MVTPSLSKIDVTHYFVVRSNFSSKMDGPKFNISDFKKSTLAIFVTKFFPKSRVSSEVFRKEWYEAAKSSTKAAKDLQIRLLRNEKIYEQQNNHLKQEFERKLSARRQEKYDK